MVFQEKNTYSIFPNLFTNVHKYLSLQEEPMAIFGGSQVRGLGSLDIFDHMLSHFLDF
jgi:hypothetical protein